MGRFRRRQREPSMTAIELFLLGVMVAWTPGLVVMAWLLRSASKERLEDELGSLDY